MWETVGVIAVTADTEQVDVGPLATETDQGRVWLQVTSFGGGLFRPLAFAIVGFVSSSGIRSLGNVKYYPDANPSVVALGPGPVSAVEGVVTFRPRSYNRQWLSVGLPARVWTLKVEALVSNGATVPSFTPRGFKYRIRKLFPTRGPVGPSGAWALRNE